VQNESVTNSSGISALLIYNSGCIYLDKSLSHTLGSMSPVRGLVLSGVLPFLYLTLCPPTPPPNLSLWPSLGALSLTGCQCLHQHLQRVRWRSTGTVYERILLSNT
jgi:hypothetical protein